MNQFKVIIAGGRDFDDYELLKRHMDILLQNVIKDHDVTVICGKAAGADTLGEEYAGERDFGLEEFPANWDKFGKSAGFRRNETIAEEADALVAFWDGNSHGTKHMIETARKKGLKVRIVRYTPRQD